MARNADVRKLVQTKMGIGRAQLYNVANDLADQLSISTADAILLLAAKNRINLNKHGGNLPPDKLKEIRDLLPHVSSANPVAATTAAAPNRKRRAPKPRRVFKVALPKAEDDPILVKTTYAEMDAMVPVYKTLYHLENSIRQFIARVLTAKHGPQWWDKLATSDLKRTYAKHTRAEEVNAWHQRRSKNPIDYLDFDQLPSLVRAAQADFVPMFFKTEGWFQNFVDELYQSRCVVCHMNPLTQTNVDYVGVRFYHWENLVKEKVHELDKLEKQASTEGRSGSALVRAPHLASVVEGKPADAGSPESAS